MPQGRRPSGSDLSVAGGGLVPDEASCKRAAFVPREDRVAGFQPGNDKRGEECIAGAYKLANARITNGESELPEGMERRAFTDVIKDV